MIGKIFKGLGLSFLSFILGGITFFTLSPRVPYGLIGLGTLLLTSFLVYKLKAYRWIIVFSYIIGFGISIYVLIMLIASAVMEGL
jgi:hypothetical protein